MHISIKITMGILWGILLSYWLWSGFNNKRTIQKEGLFKRIALYWVPLGVAFFLLGPGEWFGHSLIRENFVPHSNAVGIAGLLLCFLGLLIACRARYLLGRNWSLSVQVKQDHELITEGPYRYVRHPIYTGALLMYLGNALIVGDWRGLIAVAIVFASFWYKLQKEEQWMGNNFGPQYQEYRKRTKALLPWVL